MSLQQIELGYLKSLQSIQSPVLDFFATAIHRIIRDDMITFASPVAYLVLESPHFGLALLITLCLTELANGIIKLYSVRPRPLWVSADLKRKGNTWEKDTSFPSSHSQTVATVFAFLLFEGKAELDLLVWQRSLYISAALTLFAGFSRVYLAMHFFSDVVFGWFLGFMVALFVHQTSLISTLARLPMSYAIALSVVSTGYILGLIILASQCGQTDIKQPQIQKWLKTAQTNRSMKQTESETIRPHDIAGYQMPLGVYFGASIASVLLSRVLHTPIPVSSPQHRPHSHYSQAQPLMRFIVGIGGLLILDTLKSLLFKRQRRLAWPQWKQAGFTFGFYTVMSTWIIMGTGLICAWGWPLDKVSAPLAVLSYH